MCSVYIIPLSSVKSLSWKWINTGTVSVLIKIFLTNKKEKRNKKKSNKNLNASCINKILIACFDLLASLSLDWPSSIHLPESSSTGACFWEILSFFFKFIWSLLNHFWVPCAILFLASASQ